MDKIQAIRKIVLAVKRTAESGEAYESILKIVDVLNQPEPQPDQSRLLTRADMKEIIKEHWSDPIIVGACLSMTKQVAKAQRDLTASIKDAEWTEKAVDTYQAGIERGKIIGQARVGALVEELTKIVDTRSWGTIKEALSKFLNKYKLKANPTSEVEG